MSSEMPVLILAGGTGGHIFPGIAVADALRACDVPVLWLGSSHGLENRLVPAAGIELETLKISGLRGKGLGALLTAPWRVLRAVLQARSLLRRYRPRAALSFGGFAAGPGGLAARWLGIPLFVHEQNRVPGLTNRVLARIARQVFTGFPDVFPKRQSLWTGNPVRESICALPLPQDRPAQSSSALNLLVLGGSQGARALNTIVPAAIAKLAAQNIQVRHQCGSRMLDEARAAYQSHGLTAEVSAFFDDMASAYAWADLVICRSGALTVSELCAVGIASILVPFPAAVDDHQTANARFLTEAGAAVLMPQSTLSASGLAEQLRALAESPTQRLNMAKAARALAKPDAAMDVARRCMEASA